jgi:hypothetical protein
VAEKQKVASGEKQMTMQKMGVDENATAHEFLLAWEILCRACSTDGAFSRDNSIVAKKSSENSFPPLY